MGVNAYLLLGVAALGSLRGVAAAWSGGGEDSRIKWMQMHGWLMWAAMGVLFPLGTLLIRYGRPQRDPNAVLSPRRVMLLFYLHCFVMSLAVLCATAGIAILIKMTGTNWNYTHERLGLALWIIVLMMPFIGLVRPKKGSAARPYWFVVHWVLGTGGLFLGIVNCYIGISAYEHITLRSLRSLNIAFSIQICFMGVLYFLQDRYSYILAQGVSSREKTLPIKATGPHQIAMSL